MLLAVNIMKNGLPVLKNNYFFPVSIVSNLSE